ncbi:MAG: hypothetical protein RL721_2342 [Candidatus Eisenbacteria bacterium]
MTLIEHPPAAEDHMGAAASAAGSAAGTPDNTPAGVEPVAPGGDHEKFSIFWFSVQVLAQIAGLVALFRFGLPGVWEQQLAAGPGAFIACCSRPAPARSSPASSPCTWSCASSSGASTATCCTAS